MDATNTSTTERHTITTFVAHALHDCRDEADRLKPSLMDLRAEGVTGNAAVAIFAARDSLHLGDTAEDVADLLAAVERFNPVRVEDVWPDGVPEHWTCKHTEWLEGRVPFCTNCGITRSAVVA